MSLPLDNHHETLAPGRQPTFGEALRLWVRLGFVSFGGPAGQIAIMHTELVERHRWISNDRFLHALNYCMLLPGPEAQQLATYCGWLLHRTRGGLAAGVLFVLPSVFILWILSFAYVTWGHLPWVAAAFAGLKPAVLAIVASATLRLGRKALHRPASWVVAVAAFLAIFALGVPFPWIIGGAALTGWGLSRLRPGWLDARASTPASPPAGSPTSAGAGAKRTEWRRAGRVIAVSLVLWWTPVLLCGLTLGWDSTPVAQGLFFGKAALVTFGGAYAVLPYVAQQAVEQHGWLTATGMIDGLAFAETTPGPLIMVLQHVGFMGGWNHPGRMPPLLAATVGAAVTTWVTFVPCFLWIFLGAPHIERLRGRAGAAAALSAVTAAVVGVVLNLAIWFGWHVIRPAPGEFNAFGLVLAVLGFIALERARLDLVFVVLGGAAAGLIWYPFM